MGHEILYCSVCGRQLRNTDFEQKRAGRASGKAYCTGCLPDGVQPDPVRSPVQESPRRGVGTASGRITTSTSRIPTSRDGTTRRSVSKGKNSSTALIIGGSVGAILLILILLAALGSSGPEPSNSAASPPPPPPSIPDPPPKPPPGRTDPELNLEREKAVAQALQRARDAVGDPQKQLELYNEAVRLAQGTLQIDDARKVRDILRDRIAGERSMALTVLDKQTEAAFKEEAFAHLHSLLDKAKNSRTEPGWAEGIESRRRAYQKRIEERFNSIRAEGAAWTSLFDGTGLPHWRTVAGEPRIEQGTLVIDDGTEIVARESFADFEMRGSIRYVSDKRKHCGTLILRSRDSRDGGARVTVCRDGDVHYDSKTVKQAKAEGGGLREKVWHEFRILVKGELFTMELDGRRIFNAAIGPAAKRTLSLSDYRKESPSHLEFRNLRIRVP